MNSNLTGEYIMDSLRKQIESDLNKVFEDEKHRVVERLEREKDKVITSTMLYISNRLSMSQMGRTITLEIVKK